MDKSDVITLIASTKEKDSRGVYQVTEATRKVFCSVESIGQREFFEGGAAGFKPQLKFTMFRYDYADEQVVEYKGTRYAVYRTYIRKDDNIELYVQKELGKA